VRVVAEGQIERALSSVTPVLIRKDVVYYPSGLMGN
jgi:hypothetical protein